MRLQVVDRADLPRVGVRELVRRRDLGVLDAEPADRQQPNVDARGEGEVRARCPSSLRRGGS